MPDETGKDLVDSISQELKVESEKNSPIQASGGSWAFKFTPKTPDSLDVSVEVEITEPLPTKIRLQSKLTPEEVQQLVKWLKIVMK